MIIFLGIDLQAWDIYVPFGFFTNINIHKNIESFKNIISQYTIISPVHNNILFLADTYFK